mmetsp:Transcript_35442/g.47859  ORF Transcript_35442/g.47859 Transcript_35442/m.47859 type:complete len:238 (-) Transcript_35442:437-1150(-)
MNRSLTRSVCPWTWTGAIWSAFACSFRRIGRMSGCKSDDAGCCPYIQSACFFLLASGETCNPPCLPFVGDWDLMTMSCCCLSSWIASGLGGRGWLGRVSDLGPALCSCSASVDGLGRDVNVHLCGFRDSGENLHARGFHDGHARVFRQDYPQAVVSSGEHCVNLAPLLEHHPPVYQSFACLPDSESGGSLHHRTHRQGLQLRVTCVVEASKVLQGSNALEDEARQYHRRNLSSEARR